MENIAFNTQFITIDDLKKMNLSYYKIGKLVNKGILSKINRYTYENNEYSGEYNDFNVANAYIPDGIVCELTAAYHYGLTNYILPYIDVAINRDKKVTTLPKWPTVELHYYNDKRMNIGLVEVKNNNNKYKIFDIEKTVIDLISFRNKLPIEEVTLALKTYLNRKDRNLDKLYRYSKELRCDKILRTYLEVLL